MFANRGCYKDCPGGGQMGASNKQISTVGCSGIIGFIYWDWEQQNRMGRKD